MKNFVLGVVIAWSCTTIAEVCSSTEFQSYANVKTSVTFFMEHPGASPSPLEKAVGGVGDSAAITILKGYSDADLARPEKAKQALVVLHMAFSDPHLIGVCSDRQPRFTMLLLDHLAELHQRHTFSAEIENTRAFVTQHSR